MNDKWLFLLLFTQVDAVQRPPGAGVLPAHPGIVIQLPGSTQTHQLVPGDGADFFAAVIVVELAGHGKRGQNQAWMARPSAASTAS